MLCAHLQSIKNEPHAAPVYVCIPIEISHVQTLFLLEMHSCPKVVFLSMWASYEHIYYLDQ